VVVGLAGYLAANRDDLPPGARRPLNQVVRAVERGSDLTGKLLTFARRDADMAMEIMDLDEVVGESVEFLRRLQVFLPERPGMMARFMGEHVLSPRRPDRPFSGKLCTRAGAQKRS